MVILFLERQTFLLLVIVAMEQNAGIVLHGAF